MWATQLTSAARALGDGFRAVVLSDHVGYSSLAALKQWPIVQLKNDLFFLRGIRRSERRGYVKAIIDLGHTLGIAVVAEGVETEAQLELLATARLRRGARVSGREADAGGEGD